MDSSYTTEIYGFLDRAKLHVRNQPGKVPFASPTANAVIEWLRDLKRREADGVDITMVNE